MNMKSIQVTKQQQVINFADAKKEFTYNLKDIDKKQRYVVSCFSILTSKNPSMENSTVSKIYDFFNCVDFKDFDSIGGWVDKKTNIYYLDANIHFYSLEYALNVAYLHKQKAIFDLKENKVINLKY